MADYEYNPSLKELKSRLYWAFLVIMYFVITYIYNRSVHYPTLGNKFDGFYVFVPTIMMITIYTLLAIRLDMIQWKGQNRWYTLIIYILVPIYFSFVLSLFSFKIVNGYFDTGTPTTQTVDVVDKFDVSSGRNFSTKTYTLYIMTEKNPNKRIKIDIVDGGVYQRVLIGPKTLLMKTKPGALGYEWVVGVAPVTVPNLIPFNRSF